MSDIKLTVAVLSFQKPVETRQCLQSIRANLHVPYRLVLLDNGGAPDYAWQLYRENLCDVLISKRDGQGGGVGQTDLFRFADTEFCLFVQSDQVMQQVIDADAFVRLTDLLKPYPGMSIAARYHCVDLNGDQSNRGVWTDRAHLIKTEVFNSFAPFPNGGPGAFHHLPWNEKHMQDGFATRGCQIAHIGGTPVFRDIGVWTIRDCAGGVVRMRTDTKQVWWDKNPTEPYIFPEMTPAEWSASIGGTWVGGTIPEIYLKRGDSFNCWGDVKL